MKKLYFATLCLVTSLCLPLVSQAACDPNKSVFGNFEMPLPGFQGKTIDQVVCENSDSPVLTYIIFIVNLITAVIVIIGLITVVIGGYIYMTAGGDGDRVKLAKSFIGSALLGIVLALASFLILNTISPQFAGGLKEPSFGPTPPPPPPTGIPF